MTIETQKRTEAFILIALQTLLSEAEYDRQAQDIIAMRLQLQHQIHIDPRAVCGEIEDLIEIIKDRDRELLAV
jgi:hypothetical protein